MNRNEFISYMKSSGFKVNEQKNGVATGYGIVLDVPIALTYASKREVSILIAIAKDDWQEHSKDIKSALKGRCRVGYGNVLLLTLKLSPEEDILTAVREVISTIKHTGVRIDNTCPFCKRSGCDIAVPHNGAYHFAHKTCVESLIQKSKDTAEKNSASGSYITGIIGAILGTIVGVIPSFLTVVFMEKIYVYLFALIPLAAYYGYKTFNGKLNKVATVVTVVISILGVYFLEYAFLAHQVIATYKMSIGDFFYFLPSFLTDGGLWMRLTRNAALEFLFVILGIVIVWKQITHTSATAVANNEQLLNLSTPYGLDAYGSEYDTSSTDDTI